MQKPNNTSKEAAKKGTSANKAKDATDAAQTGVSKEAVTAKTESVETQQKAAAKPVQQNEKKQSVDAPADAIQVLDAQVITVDELVPRVQEMWNNGWRLVTQTMVDLGDPGFDVLYHFDKDLELKHFRLTVPRGATIPSISPIYFAALLIENENRDLFGVTFDGLVLDFNRTLYLEESGDPILAPFCKISTFTKLKCEV